tara:strand:+ start:194 stop:307 length:114 start_codon:yes stop_codon:yes gene_type:complete
MDLIPPSVEIIAGSSIHEEFEINVLALNTVWDIEAPI